MPISANTITHLRIYQDTLSTWYWDAYPQQKFNQQAEWLTKKCKTVHQCRSLQTGFQISDGETMFEVSNPVCLMINEFFGVKAPAEAARTRH